MHGPDPDPSGAASGAPEHEAAARPAARPTQAGQLKPLLGKLKHLKGAVAAIAGVGAILSGFVGWYTTYKTVAGAHATPAAAPAPAIHPLSILVLPFANQTGDLQKAYIADGITTCITTDLARLRDAFVIPTATAFTYKNKALTVRQVGMDAGVRFVLQGSVLASGEKLRISAQLADAQSGAQLWNETFEGDLGNLFALQDQVTARLGNSIGREMVIVAARESDIRKSSAKAAELRLHARALQLRPQTLANFEEIEAIYRQVLKLEPDNPAAMLDLANTLTIAANNGIYIPETDKVKEQKFAEGRELAVKASQIDPNAPDVHNVLGFYALNHGDHARARQAFESVLALRPKLPAAYNNLAACLLRGGESQAAINLLQQALQLNPRHPFAGSLYSMGEALFQAGRNDEAISWMQRTLEANPSYTAADAYLSMAYALKGDSVKAREWAVRAINDKVRIADLDPPDPSSPTAYLSYWEKTLQPAWRLAGLPQ
jgi:TolB-like protein/cytochrome c-type biogenesis protein CcmH/NrfG